jgi:hypothetical protein
MSYWWLVGRSARMWNGRSPESDRRASDEKGWTVAHVQRFSIADIAAGAILGHDKLSSEVILVSQVARPYPDLKRSFKQT